MKLTPIAWTWFDDQAFFETTGCTIYESTGQGLAEAAGRACYRSWSKPNPATATNAGYITQLLEKHHTSVLEHASITWYIQGVSRSLTHELVRHRVGTAISQESQRYAEPAGDWVIPPVARDEASTAFLTSMGHTFSNVYQAFLKNLTSILADTPGLSRREAIKGAREAARSVLPNMTPTSLTWTANYRALRHIIDLRANQHADREIREFAVALLRDCQRLAPNVFADYYITTHVDGSEIAVSRFQPGPVPSEEDWLNSQGWYVSE